jgi:transposase-like protein
MRKNYGIVQNHINYVLQEYAGGNSVYSIARELGCSHVSVLRAISKYKKDTKHNTNMLKDKIELVIYLRNSGKSLREISKIVGHSISSIHNLLQGT